MTPLVDRLNHPDVRERIKATYEITKETIEKDPLILKSMRKNLKTQDSDLLEITVMRLGLRAQDANSLNEIIHILDSTSDDLVRSAAIFAMSAIAKRHLLNRDIVVQRLITMKSSLSGDLQDIVEAELRDLSTGAE